MILLPSEWSGGKIMLSSGTLQIIIDREFWPHVFLVLLLLSFSSSLSFIYHCLCHSQRTSTRFLIFHHMLQILCSAWEYWVGSEKDKHCSRWIKTSFLSIHNISNSTTCRTLLIFHSKIEHWIEEQAKFKWFLFGDFLAIVKWVIVSHLFQSCWEVKLRL